MSWQKIGEVVDAVGSGRKQLLNGKEYDYVFDVDIQDGVPPLKLPYNANGMFIKSTKISQLILACLREPLYRSATFPCLQQPSHDLLGPSGTVH